MKNISQLPSQLNLVRLLLEIRRTDGTVRSSLAQSLNLSFATVSNLSKVLEENNYILSEDLTQSSGGRRAAEIRFNPSARYSLALLIEHNLRVRIALLDLSNHVIEELIVEPNNSPSVDELIDTIGDKYRSQLERHNIDTSLVIGAGVAIPGVFNRVGGIVQATTSAPLANLNLKDRLESALSCPVHIHNDADMAALAFSIEHKQEMDNILLIYFTVGIGLGIVLKGGVYNGESGFAGELGHTRWGYSPTNQANGGIELKQIVSVPSLLSEYHQKEFDDAELSQNWLPLMEEISKQYTNGEKRAVDLLRNTGRFLGQVVGSLADIFDPGVIAIGGRVEPILPIWLPMIREQARAFSFLTRNRDLLITNAPELDSMILTGCGEAAFQQWITTSDITSYATTRSSR